MAEVPLPPDAIPVPQPADTGEIGSLPLPPGTTDSPSESHGGVLPPPPPPGAAPSEGAPRGPEEDIEDAHDTETPEERLQRLQLELARAEGRNSGLESVLPSLADVARSAAASASATGGGTLTPESIADREIARQERNEVKGEKLWKSQNPLEDKNWAEASGTYARDKADLRHDEFKDQLEREVIALQSVATELTHDRTSLPNLDSLMDIDTATGNKTTIAVTTPEESTELSEMDARNLAIDLFDALAQRAGEAYALHQLGELDETFAKKCWQECTEAAGTLSQEVLYPIGNTAREAFNGKNAHLKDKANDPTISDEDYRKDTISFTRRKFFSLARSTYGNKAIQLSEAYELVHLKPSHPNYKKLTKEKKKTEVAPRAVAKVFASEPITEDEEAKKHVWDKMDKIYHAGGTLICAVSGLLTATAGRAEVVTYGLGGGALVYGGTKLIQSKRTHNRQELAINWRERAHVVDHYEVSAESDPGSIEPASTSLSKQVQPKYPKSIEAFSDEDYKEKYGPVIRLRGAKGVAALATTAALLGAGVAAPSEEAGARTGEMDVDGFRNQDRVAPAELEGDNPGLYEGDTQLDPQGQEEVQRLMEEEGMTFQEALEALDSGS